MDKLELLIGLMLFGYIGGAIIIALLVRILQVTKKKKAVKKIYYVGETEFERIARHAEFYCLIAETDFGKIEIRKDNEQ